MSDARFWTHVQRGPSCWEWTGALTSAGYGNLRRDGRNVLAHRYSWILCGGAIPNGLQVLHRCDNRRCVRPAHLFTGTQSDNLHDMVSKGRRVYRSQVGEQNTRARLTADDVRSIRAARAAGLPAFALAQKYGVTKTHIYDIASGRAWHELQPVSA